MEKVFEEEEDIFLLLLNSNQALHRRIVVNNIHGLLSFFNYFFQLTFDEKRT